MRWTLSLILVAMGMSHLAFAAPAPQTESKLQDSEATRTSRETYGIARNLPPSWNLPPAPDVELEDSSSSGRSPNRNRRRQRPWYNPRVALGIGLNIPELIPFEGVLSFGRFFALRLFFTPSIPFNIRVDMPSDVISFQEKNNLVIANPDFTIRLKANYGPQYGIDFMTFPWAGSFFLSGGMSYRAMRLKGDAKSKILICSGGEAVYDPPCADPNASIRPDTALQLELDAKTEALLARFSLGGWWHVGDTGYFSLTLGGTRPMSVKRTVRAQATLDSPSGDDGDVTGALAQVKAERETDLQQKATDQMRPVDERTLPILGLSAGVRF